MQPDPASGPSGKHPMRILIVDDHEVFRAACRALLRTEGMDVIANVPAGSTAITTAIALRPEMAIVDVTPADDTGMGIVRRLAALPNPPTVVLTSSANRCQFGSQLDGYRFVAKADLRAEAIAVAAGYGSSTIAGRRPIGTVRTSEVTAIGQEGPSCSTLTTSPSGTGTPPPLTD
jgi:CheY-like chemotaxis protein